MHYKAYNVSLPILLHSTPTYIKVNITLRTHLTGYKIYGISKKHVASVTV